MIGITEMARFTGVAGWPAVFPPFARAAWLGIMPEFNPFKYNSFPVNGGRQSSLMTRTLQPRLARFASEGRMAKMPPVLTFQSVMDFTTNARAVVQALHENLPDNGSELVLFDLNRNASYGPLMRANTHNILATLLPAPPRHYAVSLVTNRSRTTREVALLRVAAGSVAETRRDLELSFPPGVFSLSHIALPYRSPLPARRFTLWHRAAGAAGIRRAPRRDFPQRRAEYFDCFDRYAGAHVMQSLPRFGDGENRHGDSLAG